MQKQLSLAGKFLLGLIIRLKSILLESTLRNHCGVEKRLTHLAHNQEIVGSNPTHRNQEFIETLLFVFCILDPHSNIFF